MSKTKVIILRTAGTNCDLETAHAFRMAGADTVDLVHINKLFRKEAKLSDYSVIAIPGGFSYGDDISAGKVFANKLIYQLAADIRGFVKAGKLIIGICNGFQVLVKTGLLEADLGDDQSMTLSFNDSAKFECRWINLRVNADCESPWLKGLPEIIKLPVAHAEGKFIPKDELITAQIVKNNRVAFQYCDEDGNPGEYPVNPNGAAMDIAGVCDKTGRILGLMPHPERFVSKYQSALWTSENEMQGEGHGLKIFRNAVNYIKENL
ncbi:MAG: phosphoribosylformylglycinamidine synthase I [Elusimicrobia bacterium RIFOXYB2_FULL_48_7]|nr:MAG: phosphoribosylformylglycinamidine synthase I [Elusimicrobia bacterium RIFOXYB2_FULL_48_7]